MLSVKVNQDGFFVVNIFYFCSCNAIRGRSKVVKITSPTNTQIEKIVIIRAAFYKMLIFSVAVV